MAFVFLAVLMISTFYLGVLYARYLHNKKSAKIASNSNSHSKSSVEQPENYYEENIKIVPDKIVYNCLKASYEYWNASRIVSNKNTGEILSEKNYFVECSFYDDDNIGRYVDIKIIDKDTGEQLSIYNKKDFEVVNKIEKLIKSNWNKKFIENQLKKNTKFE